MASDSFTGTDNTALSTHDANWKDVSSSWKASDFIISGNTVITNWTWRDAAAYYDASTSDTSEIVFKGTATGFLFRRVAVRMGENTRGYTANFSAITGSNYTELVVQKNGNWVATLTNAGSWAIASDHTIKIVASGTSTVTIRVYVDGTEVGSGYTDSSSSITSGHPGFYTSTNGNSSLTAMDDWNDGAAAESAAYSGRGIGRGISRGIMR